MLRTYVLNMSSEAAFFDQLTEIKTLICDKNEVLSNKIDNLYLDLTTTIKALNNKVTVLEIENKSLKSRVESLEKNRRKNNIVLFGLKTDENRNASEFVAQKLGDLLQISVTKNEINNVYRVPSKNSDINPIIVEFVNFNKKLEVFKNCRKLKGTSISISNDLSKEEREINRVLVRNLKEARDKGLSAKIKNNLLYVQEESFTYEQLLNKNKNSTNDDVFVDAQASRSSVSAPCTPSKPEALEEKEKGTNSLASPDQRPVIAAAKPIVLDPKADSVPVPAKPKINSHSSTQKKSSTPTNRYLSNSGITTRVTRTMSQTSK